jgi:hypothetical protein
MCNKANENSLQGGFGNSGEAQSIQVLIEKVINKPPVFSDKELAYIPARNAISNNKYTEKESHII